MDIGVLPGLRRKVRLALYAAGISTVEQVASLEPAALQQFKGIKTTAYAIRASAQAFLADQPVWYDPLPDVCRQDGYMFDLETIPDSGIPWSLGWSDGCGAVQIALVAPGAAQQTLTLLDGQRVIVVPHKDAAWQVFAESLSGDSRPVYHWTGFDAGIMRATAPDDVKAGLLGRMHDLHRSFNRSVRLPVSSTSLKVIARYFRFSWTGSDRWEEAYLNYRAWLRRGDLRLLTHACAYQRDDVEALGVVWRWLVDNRP